MDDTTDVHTADLPIRFNPATCRFEEAAADPSVNFADATKPLSVILQVTRHCNFDCIFCSETESMPDPTLDQLAIMKRNLYGVPRVAVSGGEPLIRNDIEPVLDLFHDGHIVALATNGSIQNKLVPKLHNVVDFVNIGFEGPRAIISKMRADYDTIIAGIRAFEALGIPLSLTCVILRSTVDSVPYTCQMGELLNARKIKLILPIPKGNAVHLPDSEYLSEDEAQSLFSTLCSLKDKFDWRMKITLTTWTKDVEGYSLLVYPDGETHAWPVYDQPEKVLRLGNLLQETIHDIWQRYPYKENHYRKYLGQSIRIC